MKGEIFDMADELLRINIKITKTMMEKYIDDFIDDEIMDEKAESTYEKYRLVLTKFIESIENEEVSKKDMIAYKQSMQQRQSTITLSSSINL